ncbi:hypothetical protein HK101_001459 [Irineochytrium annulatum]|nr:hypothetical protein HK101_001459 [Irineochytrium annulatum]
MTRVHTPSFSGLLRALRSYGLIILPKTLFIIFLIVYLAREYVPSTVASNLITEKYKWVKSQVKNQLYKGGTDAASTSASGAPGTNQFPEMSQTQLEEANTAILVLRRTLGGGIPSESHYTISPDPELFKLGCETLVSTREEKCLNGTAGFRDGNRPCCPVQETSVRPQYFVHTPHDPYEDIRYAPFMLTQKRRLDDLLLLLQAWNEFCQTEGISYWLAHGSLLGWVWNRKMLPWDKDIKVEVTMQTLRELRNHDTLALDRRYIFEVNPNYVYRAPQPGNTPDARLTDTMSGFYIEIHALHSASDDASDTTEDMIVASKQPSYYKYSHVFPLQSTVFEGVPVWRPNEPVAILYQEYGLEPMVQETTRTEAGDTWVWNAKEVKWQKSFYSAEHQHSTTSVSQGMDDDDGPPAYVVRRPLKRPAPDVEIDDDALFAMLERDDDDMLANIREKRMKEIKSEMIKHQEMAGSSHGTYEEIHTEKEVLTVTTKTDKVIVHFFHKEFRRCQIMDKHLGTLARKHFRTRFVKADVEKCNFLVEKLKVIVLPCVIAFIKGVSVDRVVGFDELGGTDDFATVVLERRLAKCRVIEGEGGSGGSGGILRFAEAKKRNPDDEYDDDD